MSRDRSRLYFHLAGAMSLGGWIVLAVVSHKVERPLWIFLGVLAWEWLIFLAAWRWSAGTDFNLVKFPILLWAVLFLLCGLLATPLLEDDQFRFLWDGRQFATTGNPYGVPPANLFGDATVSERFQQILDQINYPHVPTIYGPVCQLGFLVSYWIAPGQIWPWKMLLIFAAIGLIQYTIRIAQRRQGRAGDAAGSRPSSAAAVALLAGWCPLLIFETGFNAHPDLLGVAFLTAAMFTGVQKRDSVCGVLCGLAAGSKVFALLLVPFLLRRSRRAWVGFVVTVILLYAPFWLQGSGGDFTGLAAFAKDWEFNSSLYALARWSLGISAGKILCGLIFVAAWAVLLFRWYGWARDFDVPPGAAVYGALLLLAPTVNPWYLLWLFPFVALRPTAAGIAAMALVSLSYVTALNLGDPSLGNFEHPVWVRPVEYGGIALVGIAQGWRRWKTG